MDSPKIADSFDAYYYAHGCGRPYQRDDEWLGFFDKIAARIASDIGPASVLDAGCAMGFLVERLRARGVEAFGIDISEYAIGNVHESVRPFCWAGSVAVPFPRRYDLIVTIEVLEHMPPDEAERAVANFCQHTDDILFSSTPNDYKEASHVNVHPPEYWAVLFARQGFFRDVDFDGSFLAPWATRFRRRSDPPPRLISDYERKYWLLWKENADLRALAVETRDELARLHDQQSRNVPRLIELERTSAILKAQVADKERGVAALNKRIADLEAAVAQKNNHIGYLESLLRQIENGRVMRALRVMGNLRRRGQPAPAAPAATAAAPAAPADPYADWIARAEPDAMALLKQREAARQLKDQPLISVITPVFDPGAQVLRETIESVLAQTYERWELCLADGGSTAPGVRAALEEYAGRDPRIRVSYLGENRGISGNSNAALAMAGGAYVVLLDHDDLLAPDMLFEVVALLNHDRAADVIYYDEDKVAEDGKQRHSPWFKPAAFSPDLLLSTNYMMHCVVRRKLLNELGGFDPAANGAQDWDLSLRLSERTRAIAHIPKVLYHWRQVVGSAARDANAKPWAFAAQEGCIEGHLRRIGAAGAKVTFPTLGRVRVLWPSGGAKVSIVIPTKDKVELLRPCLDSIRERSTYANYEIVLVDTGSAEAETHDFYAQLAGDQRVRIVELAGPFNWSAANNHGARAASGDVLVFLNNDIEVLEADWLEELAGWVSRPEVGVVGCKLIRPDGTIQHAGIAMGVEGHGSHVFDGDRENDYGPFGTPEWCRDYMAVTGACMAMRREVWQRLNGFDEIYRVGYSDIEICLRAVDVGLRVVYTPFARMLHHEGGSRGFTLPPSDVLRATIQMFPRVRDGDPFWSPNLAQMRRRPAIAPAKEDSREMRLLDILKNYELIDRAVFDLAPLELADRAALQWRGATDVPPELAKRLLLVTHDLSFSGAPLVLYMLARYLQGEGYTIGVLSAAEGPLEERYTRAGMAVIVAPGLKDDARIAAAALAEYGAAIVNTIVCWRSVYAARAAGRPAIWYVHESSYGQELARTEPRVAGALAVADAVLFPARATADLYRPLAPAANFVPVHTGLDMQRLEGHEDGFRKRPGTLCMVALASLEPRKGQDVLLEALRLLPADVLKGLECYLVGRALDWEFYRELTGAAADMPNVHVVGEVPHERVTSYLRAADIFVLPSRDEALPISMLEAMHYGKGVVAANVGGVAEVVEHEANGLVVPAEDAPALAAAIERMARDTELRARLGARARDTFEADLTIERFGSEVATLLGRVVGGKTE
jgi:O-antigen biosynthesis protein